MKDAKYISSVIKCILFIIFLFNLGIWGGLHDFFTKFEDTTDRETLQAIYAFSREKIKLAEEKVAHNGRYTEEEYYADLVEIIRKMRELNLKPGVPPAVNRLRGIQMQGGINHEKHATIAKIVFNYPDIKEYFFQNSETLIEKDDFKKIPAWLRTMYLKNFCLALIFLLLGSQANKRILRNPLSFTLLLAFYPITISYIFYRWFKILGRGYLAEIEFRRTKEKLFALLSQDEIAQIKKFAESNISFANWRKGFVLRHSFWLALLATLVIAVIPKQVQADKGSTSLLKGDTAQIIQHLPRMDIEDNTHADGKDFLDYLSKTFICQTCDLPVVKQFFELVCLLTLFSPQYFVSVIEHIPIKFRCLKASR